MKLRETEGAARLHTKTVEEMARDAAASRANAQAADKGKMTRTEKPEPQPALEAAESL